MTNLEQALTYIHRELKFMAIDPSGAANRHKFADKVIEDVTDVPNLCSSALAAAKPLAPILNAVRGPRGNALMKFFNVSLHDTRMEMTMVVAEATRLQGRRSHKTEDAYDYLSSMYRAAVRKARKLVHGRAENQESYLDKYTNLQKFTGFGGAGLNDFDIDDDDDGDTGFFMGDSVYAEEALNALRNGDPVPMPQSAWGMSTNYPGAPLEGNANVINQIRAIEARIGRPLTDSELDSFLTGEKMISPMPASQNFDEQFFADLGRLQNGQPSQPASPEDSAKEAAIQMIMSGAIDLRDIAKLVSKNSGDSEELAEAPAAVTVDPDALRAAAPAGPPIDTDLEALIRARNNLSPRTSAQPDSTPAPAAKEVPSEETKPEEESDGSSNNGGPDEQSGPPSDLVEHIPSEENDMTPSMHELGMKSLINVIGGYSHDDLREALRNIFSTAGSELGWAFIALTSSSDPDKLLTLKVYANATHSSELVNPMTVNIAVIGHAGKIASDIGISPSLIDEEIHIAEGPDTLDTELSRIYGSKLVFWSEGIQRNLECSAILACFMYRYCNLNVRIDYVSDYPKAAGKERLVYLYSLYPKTEDLSFDALRETFNGIASDVWKSFIMYFNDVSNVPLSSGYLELFSLAIRIPEDIETEKYLDDYEDLQIQVIRGENVSLIPGLQYLISCLMDLLKSEIENDPTEPAQVLDAQFDYCPAFAKESLVYEFNLKLYTSKKLSNERKEELDRILKADHYSSVVGELAMMASASRVKFETYMQIIDPSEETHEESTGDAATQAVEELVGSLATGSSGDAVVNPEAQTNAFGLQ